jgi:hypothetical protein
LYRICDLLRVTVKLRTKMGVENMQKLGQGIAEDRQYCGHGSGESKHY